MTTAPSGRSRVSLRLFATCWLILCLHFATDIVREHYLSFSLAEDYSFRMDKYLGFHVDIFETPGRGAHIGNNPGVSMIGAIPYLAVRPIIDRVTAAINARRTASGEPITAIYNDPRPRRVAFYKTVREQGLDIRFGLASGVIHVLFMAPLSAFAAVFTFRTLSALGVGTRFALLGGFLYVLGTPIFFRTAFLNQNLFIAHLALFGFVALWRPGDYPRWSDRRACVFAGLMGGYSLVSDYSGGVVLAWLGLYAAWRGWQGGTLAGAWRHSLWYLAGATGPILLLLFYQYRAFGSPWYPGQHYMPPVEWIEIGYQGVAGPKWELFWLLLLDSRFGLLTSAPWLGLSVVGLYMAVRRRTWLPAQEAWFLAGFAAVFLVFFSAVQYTRLQWVTGIRYMLPVVPALFLLSMVPLLKLSPFVRFVALVLIFAQAWAMSMVRSYEIADSIARAFLGGPQLPWVSTLSRMAPQYLPFLERDSSPVLLFVMVGALIYGIWRYPEPESLSESRARTSVD
jgi:hypothetical protein